MLEKLSKSELFNTIIPGRLFATRTSHGKILELRVCGPAGTGRASESATAGKFGNHKSRGELNGLERSKDRDTKYDYTKRIDSQNSSGFQDARSKQRFSTTSRSSSDSCNETNEHISQPENKLGHLDRRKNTAEVANSQSTTNTSSCKNNSQKVLARSGSQIQEVGKCNLSCVETSNILDKILSQQMCLLQSREKEFGAFNRLNLSN